MEGRGRRSVAKLKFKPRRGLLTDHQAIIATSKRPEMNKALPDYVVLRHRSNLSLANHVYCFNTLDRLPR